MVKSLIARMAVATLLVPVSVPAQEADNVGHGRQIAQTICVECHVVVRDQRVSPNREAPPFPSRDARHDQHCLDRRPAHVTPVDAEHWSRRSGAM
jgi:hypothetical protein